MADLLSLPAPPPDPEQQERGKQQHGLAQQRGQAQRNPQQQPAAPRGTLDDPQCGVDGRQHQRYVECLRHQGGGEEDEVGVERRQRRRSQPHRLAEQAPADAERQPDAHGRQQHLDQPGQKRRVSGQRIDGRQVQRVGIRPMGCRLVRRRERVPGLGEAEAVAPCHPLRQGVIGVLVKGARDRVGPIAQQDDHRQARRQRQRQ